MKGLLEEGKGIMEETEMGAVRDAGIIACSSKMEHLKLLLMVHSQLFAKSIRIQNKV